MHNDRQRVEDRVHRALTQRIRPAVHSHRVPLTLAAWHVPDEPVPVADALAADYEDFAVGRRWGAPWSTSWIRATGTIPPEWAGRRVEAHFDLGFVGDWPGNQAEALVYDATGSPIKGIAPDNQVIPLQLEAAGGESVHLLLEAAANPDILAGGMLPTPLGDKATAPKEPLYTMGVADLVVLETQVWHLAVDMEVLDGLSRQLSDTDARRFSILRALDRALDVLDLDDVAGSAAAARAELVDVLARPANASAHTLSSVGHAHIDSAWLWPLRETVRKTARTFSNVTALAKEYPEFVFACSQAQQYAWIKESQPEVYRRMQEAAKAGQWVPVGGMWVEADGNLPGGEALARQFTAGKNFFLSEFGYECKGVWLPDSFGYTAAYPQIAKLAGMDWFLTQKISWNQTNDFPHHTFRWEGIDGTQIFTHFPPIDTYNATFAATEVAHAAANYSEKGHGTRSLVPFGHGDGGGGPTREMLERARRLRDLEGSAKVVVQDPNVFFADAQAEYPDPPVWSGELYLELHRATYTSQARTKSGNRRSEHLLREAELWATTAAVRAGTPYPYDSLDALWKTVLLNQFHDILPGSSIAWVHAEAEATYARVADELNALVGASVESLSGPGESTWVLNTSPRDRTEVLTLPERGTRVVSVPASGAVVLDDGGDGSDGGEHGAADGAPVEVSSDPRGTVLSNGLVTLVIDADGLFASVRDEVAGREVIAPGRRGNLLQLHADLPNGWDAWDVDVHYRNQVVDLVEAEEVTVVEDGPMRAAVRVVRTVRASTITQLVVLRAGSPRIDVETEIDWHEQEKFLKASFPLDVHADRSASEIQFGHVYRPTHVNTSWDAARFEVAAHRWVHVAEPGYGVALVNDSTYGHDTTRASRPDGGTTTTVRLSLLRGPRCPDPYADQGSHHMTYSLLPAAGIAEAVDAGYELNLPLRVVPGRSGAAPAPLVSVTGAGATLEAVKLADDRSGDVVLRLYEAWGARALATVSPGFAVASAVVTDLLERPLADAPTLLMDDGGGLAVELRPFQVLTLRLARS